MKLAYSFYKLKHVRWHNLCAAIQTNRLKGKPFLYSSISQSAIFFQRPNFRIEREREREMTLILNYFYMFNIKTIYIREYIIIVQSIGNI